MFVDHDCNARPAVVLNLVEFFGDLRVYFCLERCEYRQSVYAYIRADHLSMGWRWYRERDGRERYVHLI